jgi:hypothetical protein
MNSDELLKFIDGLEVEETQPVSFSFMNDIARIVLRDMPSVNEVDEKERIIVPEELIPFLE